MNEEFDEEFVFDDTLSNLSPQEILKHLNSENVSGNPYNIMKAINNYNAPKLSPFSELNDGLIEAVGGYDYLTKDERNSLGDNSGDDSFNTKLNIHEILDEIINQDNDINCIEFNEDQENIFEVEELNHRILDDYINTEVVAEKDIPEKIRDKNKKIGSTKQKTINIYKVYGSRQLIFKDEAEELYLLLQNKLLIYWDVIIDFEDVEVSETFLKFSIGNLCKWLTPTEILQRVTMANLEDEVYSNFVKNTLHNSYKYWMNVDGVLEQNIALDKLELYRSLIDESMDVTLEEFQSSEKLADKKIPFEFISAQYLGKKREKKLKYPVYFIEKITNELLEKYKINDIIYSYISQVIDHKIIWEEVDINNKQAQQNEKYKLQFGIDEFKLIYEFTQSVLLDKCYAYLEDAKDSILGIKKEINDIKSRLPDNLKKNGLSFYTIYMDTKLLKNIPDHVRFKLRRLEELEFALMDLEHKYFIKEDILKNVFEIISFSMYKTGLDKIKLIAFHYITSYLETYSEQYWENVPTKKIRGYMTLIEIFRFELVSILQDDDNLRKFVFTIKELILKWVFKYTYTTPIAKVYFDFLMITPEILTEMVLRYIALIAVKNKNPITLRAIYSSYISLIHTSIYLNINSDVYDKKYGFLGSLLNLKNEEPDSNRFNVPNNNMIYTSNVIRTFMLKNPRLLNENYFLLKRLSIQPILELNSLRLYATKPEGIPLHNWWIYYVKYFQHMDPEATYKIKSKFLKSDKRNAQQNYINIITHELLREPLYKRIKDYSCVDIILDGICEDISMRTINRGYLDNNLCIEVKSHNDYFDDIYNLLKEIKKKLEG